MESSTFTINLWGKYTVGINKFLLPIKVSLFCWFAAGRIFLIFIPVYVKQQGLTIMHLSTIILVGVCFQFLAGAISGILADKVGRVKPFLFVYASTFLLTLICFIIMPKVDECSSKNITFDCSNEESSDFTSRDLCQNFQDNVQAIAWLVTKNGSATNQDETSRCLLISSSLQGSIIIEKHLNKTQGLCLYQGEPENLCYSAISSCGGQNCESFQLIFSPIYLTNCHGNRSIKNILLCGLQICKSFQIVCCLIEPTNCLRNRSTTDISSCGIQHCKSFKMVFSPIDATNCHRIRSATNISSSSTQNSEAFQIICCLNDSTNCLRNKSTTFGTQISESFQIDCFSNDLANCHRNITVWIVVYGIVIVLSYVSLSSAHRCFDVISADLSNRHNSDFGKQRLWSILGTSAGPSIAGLILEKTTSNESGKNYDPIFVCAIILTILAILPVWKVDSEFHKPATELCKKTIELMKTLEISLFFLLLLVTGMSLAFQMLYGSWYLQSLGASDLLIGISKSISSLCGLPFLYMSKWFFDKTGVRNFFVLSLLCYVFYSFAFSLMREPWLAMGFELANIFSYHLFWPAVMQYCEEIAPVEMQATMKGIAGVMHFNIARIGTTVIGGYIMNHYGGRAAYQVIGYICLGYASVYCFYLIIRYLQREKTGVQLKPDRRETSV